MRISDWSSDVCSSDLLLRLDSEGEPLRQAAVDLTERFIDDMDGQLRQISIGDFVVGKHVGKMMGALGGRMDAYGPALAGEGDLDAALVRNLYRGNAPEPSALAFVSSEVRALRSEEHTSELQSLMRISYAVFCLKKKKTTINIHKLCKK